MTDYNIDFLIAGLVFLIFLLIHFQRYKKLNNISGRTFWFLIIAGIFCLHPPQPAPHRGKALPPSAGCAARK